MKLLIIYTDPLRNDVQQPEISDMHEHFIALNVSHLISAW